MPTVSADFARPTAQQLAAFAAIGAATAHEAMGRRGALDSAIKPILRGSRVLGPAFPSAGRPGDNLTLHAALALARPGDMLVYSVEGFADGAAFGDVMAEAARIKGIAGVVLDGAARDGNVLRVIGLPVFARGLSLKSRGDKAFLGPIAVPVVVGGVKIAPGDLIIGDDDGVVVVPLQEVDAIAAIAREREVKEAKLRQRLAAGETTTWDLFGPTILGRKNIAAEI
ncbi:MAG: hypothetical protein WAS21_21320 [Geminicoccaceae bacterium]